MSSGFYFWLCYIKLRVCEPEKNSCRWTLVYCSFPAKALHHLLGFQNEKLKIIAIFNFHPMNSCAIAEIDEPEQLKASIKVLIVGDDLLNFKLAAITFRLKSTLVAYYGFDVETAMQIAANKQVDIIIVNTAYSGKYNDKQVNGVEIAKMLKFNPDTAQIPVILKLCGQVMVGDRERYLNESGADDAIRLEPGNWDFFIKKIKYNLIEKIKYNLPADDLNPNARINLENRVSGYRPVKIQEQKESVLEFIAFKLYQIFLLTAGVLVYLFSSISRRSNSFRK
jgi:two-component system, cell cycle response regulator DivK